MDRREFIKLSAGAAAVLAAPAAVGRPAAAPPRLPIGMNLAGIADYEPGFPFRNLMWGARLWMTQDLHGYGKWDSAAIDRIPLDENGYPLELPLKVDGLAQPQTVFTLVPNVLTPGRYVLLYDGEGDFDGVMATDVVGKSPGRVELHMRHEGRDPDNPNPTFEGIRILRSKKGNHVRNMRIVALADEHVNLDKDPFLPEFVEFCRPFHALRFMDWMCTNGSLEEEWAHRKKRSFYTMAGESGDPDDGIAPTKRLLSGGVSIDVCIDLCNRLGVDAWFNVPHRATDDYIERFARMVKDRLDPRLKVYCEYSNELWNFGFVQSQWMLSSELAAAPLEGVFSSPWVNKAKHEGKEHPERIGVLFSRCFSIWQRVFAGDARRRLVRVCAVQAGWLDTAQRTLKYCMDHGGADALAPAAYFGPGEKEYAKWKARGASLTAGEVIADLDIAFARDTSKWVREDAALARHYNVEYLVYEGGQHLQPEGQEDLPYMPALAAAQKNTGMYDLYLKDLRLHQQIGCKLFCAYSSVTAQGSRWGSWGVASRYGQPLSQTPKLRALLDANSPRGSHRSS